MAAKKYYVVWAGHQPGIYDNWPEAERQVKGFPKARYKGFTSLAPAEQAYKTGASLQSARRSGKTTKPSVTTGNAATAPPPCAEVEIYCDGACEPNPGNAGTGIAVYRNGVPKTLWYGLYNPNGTNNSAELLGLYHSLLMARSELESGQTVIIYCDSMYAINCITNWAFAWKAKGWTRKGGPILNLELIQKAHALYQEIANAVLVEHVRGHAGIEGNELADRMSMVAIARQETALKEFTDGLSVTEILTLERG